MIVTTVLCMILKSNDRIFPSLTIGILSSRFLFFDHLKVTTRQFFDNDESIGKFIIEESEEQ